MANRPAPGLVINDDDRAEVERLTRSSTVRAGLAQRARIVLAAGDGVANARIAAQVGVSVPTVLKWRVRFARAGLGGLGDQARSGRPRHVDRARVIATTLRPPPKKYGVTHWSTRLLADHLRVGNATVAVIWREAGIQPWRAGSFRFSTDPELVAKVTDVVGLYLAPPQNAVVLCVDAKSQIQALDRTAPVLPTQPHLIERRSSDYVRHGTTTLFAALEIATGKVTAACKPRHRRQEFGAFLRQVARAYPEVRAWLTANPRVLVHFTPTHASWMNLVEVWFSIIERQGVHRGTYRSVKDLNAKIRQFIDGWNDRTHPFVWTKTADDILKKANRQTTSDARH